MSVQQLADLVGCAKSYISMLESGARTSPPSEQVVLALEAAMELAPGELLALARWQSAPESVRRRVLSLEDTQRSAAEQLRSALRAISTDPTLELAEPKPEPDPVLGTSRAQRLDELWRSGKLTALVNSLAGGVGPSTADSPTSRESEAGKGAQRAARSGSAVELRQALPLEVPLINSVAAGYPTEFTDLGYPARVADEYVRTPDVRDPDAFAARVVGDSMQPTYQEGDIVVFSPSKPVKSGMDCFVRLERNGESTFKRVIFEPAPPSAADRPDRDELSGEMVRLVPLNEIYAERVVPREHIAAMYAAVSVTRSI